MRAHICSTTVLRPNGEPLLSTSEAYKFTACKYQLIFNPFIFISLTLPNIHLLQSTTWQERTSHLPTTPASTAVPPIRLLAALAALAAPLPLSPYPRLLHEPEPVQQAGAVAKVATKADHTCMMRKLTSIATQTFKTVK